MSTSTTIQCPNCGTLIDIDAIFYKQVEEKFKEQQLEERRKLQKELEDRRKEYKAHFDALKAKEEQLREEKERFDEELRRATREQLRKERSKLTEELKGELAKEQAEAMALMQKELEEKSKQIRELSAAKIEIERLKREREELALKAKAEAEAELNKRLAEEKAKAQKYLEEMAQKKLKEIEEAQALKLKEKDEQLKQLQRSLEDAKRKAEQGSMQVQGEALELAIEGWLRSQFPFDSIEEVKKGAFGADCIQTVHTRDAQNCGVICYESKNTKAWSDAWIGKLKQDMLKVGADIGVLVSSVYPPGMERMGWVDGIWVCSLEEFRGSAALLRESLIRVHQAMQREENKADKMTLLYNYLTGNEFQMQLRAIVDGFMQMQNELDKEKRSLMAAWKRRQKLIDSVLANTTEMYGALQGIAGGNALPKIDVLELPEEPEE
ncbi:DUF2130 domain-containing protein [Nitratifractor salsuginis]|uniref:Caldesmon n=1 Tax=Nitratifractor salsuginis (strain DSM 16511 / JCM 12458 / E9I37-1) TaxID=749222 RepID=E6X0V4_NITSE|nr:DUF2130 domain-containing protein [Nitratifractor salsuginis]ADV46886.1 Protein of unknown function DUF2130 [Nitratifractor salsuginis DSM 16511]